MASSYVQASAEEPDADETPLGAESESIGEETENDLGQKEIDYSDVVLAPSDWTVETVLSQLAQGAFELSPNFQRRNAWTVQRKSKFIESLILGLPIPQITLAESEDQDGEIRYIVIDGKQRMLTLKSFFDENEPLRLAGLAVLDDLNGRTRDELMDSPVTAKAIRRLNNRTIRTVVIRKWPSDDFLHLVFHRINHQTLSLSAQELRQALYPGPFTSFADTFAAESVELHQMLGASQQPDFRMRDVELLVRHLAMRNFLAEYAGNLKKFLDDACDRLNSSWSKQEGMIREQAAACVRSIAVTNSIFGEASFRRFDRDRWETRFNRAVFDVMSYYFSLDEVVQAVDAEQAPLIKAEFADLSANDPKFRDSVQSTTKTVGATVYRLEAWGDRLEQLLGLALPVPRLAADQRTIRL
ncbi:DUF262 domain-containing protein [Modestobacter sp. NPDC049651]|uniref:DUF262 domain-containing protein n=1 Tax=unclassified Modestobacter TaxID=2643866 RepID=UPI0034027136